MACKLKPVIIEVLSGLVFFTYLLESCSIGEEKVGQGCEKKKVAHQPSASGYKGVSVYTEVVEMRKVAVQIRDPRQFQLLCSKVRGERDTENRLIRVSRYT